jgi:hypothetical protein
MPQDISSAIHTLKAEILSPDWTLSPGRNSNCTKAMFTLHLFFNQRRYVKGLIAIAKQILIHLSRENNFKDDCIDVLKEIMAHIVTIYEQDENTALEKKLCAQYLKRFQQLDIPFTSTRNSVNKFTVANASLQQNVNHLQSLSPQFNTLSDTKQIQAMLTIQSLIAETKILQKLMTPPT